MSEPIFVRRFLARPGVAPVDHNVRIDMSAGLITRVSPASAEAVRGHRGGGLLAIPSLANAHDHGRGVRYLAYGGVDQPLECWVPSVYLQPAVDPYLNAAVAFARHARAGIGAVLNFHIPNRPDAFEAELRAVARAADDVGLRVAIVVPLRDRNPLAYGEDDRVLALLEPDDRETVLNLWRRPSIPPEEQVARVRAVAQQCEGPLVQVQLGPVGAQWCSDRLLEQVATESAQTGRRVHMHLLETRYQREWADAVYPAGVVEHLRQLGLLSPRLSVAHGVWLTDTETACLAEHEVTVVLNTSSNLRLRSGIAPVRRFLAARVPLALGLDSLALDEDDDALAELRLAYLLHSGPGFHDAWSAATLFQAAVAQGAYVVTGAANHYLPHGTPVADLALLDYEAMSGDLVEGLVDELDVLLVRGSSRYVRSLIVAGRRIVADGVVTGLDERALLDEARRQTMASGPRLHEHQPILRRYQAVLRTFYMERRHTQRPPTPPAR